MRLENFTDYWTPEPNTGCWLWTKSCNPDGYGQMRCAGQMMASHRVSWLISRWEIPSGLCVLHKCDTPSCVNPEHLFLGTKGDNNRDRASKNRFPPIGEKHPCSKLSERQIKEIRSSGKSLSELSQEYGVAVSQISRIKNGKRWSHVK